MEKYLTIIKNPNIRKVISINSATKRPIIRHEIFTKGASTDIERGTYENIPRDQRICKLCDSGEIEDEFHFTLKCQKFGHLRENSNGILKTMFELNTTDESKRKLL